MQSFGLKYLLSYYCQVDVDKKYQLADWRIRPLEEEMLKYARQDTHYLLYIYDKMTQELLEKGNTQANRFCYYEAVLRTSTELCM